MTTRFTEEQQTAIDLSGASVVLSAGAGCGKTTVLTERFIRALSLEGGVSLDRVVVLTFTDKAAAELRTRVRRACRAKLAEGEDVDYWRGVLRGLEAAPIGTFHNQFGNILRRHAVWAGVDPEFIILDDVIAQTLREQSVDACLREFLSTSDSDLRELAVSHGLDRVRETLITLLSHRSVREFAVWAIKTSDEVMEIWEAVFARDVKPLIHDRLREGLSSTYELMKRHDYSFHKVMHERNGLLLDLIWQATTTDPTPELLQEIAETAKIQGAGSEKAWPDAALYAEVRDTFKDVRDRVIKQALAALAFDPSASLSSADHGIRFARLAARSHEHYRAIKTDRGALDFDDLLTLTLDLLSTPNASVQNALKDRFDLILVDEFQDTDPVQDQIIRLIAGDNLADGKLFIVGDFKQSIYGFRGALPELFANYRHEFHPEACLPLATNFRSRPGIIEFVNASFADAFAHDYEPLIAGRADDLGERVAPVVFSWPELSADGPAPSRSGPKVEEKRQNEARRIARTIRSWIDEKRPVFDPSLKVVRPMHGGDVAILFRTQSIFPMYENALAQEGLDFHAIGGLAFYAQTEVQDIINVLSVIDDPNDALALAGSLRGPFFRLSDEALFWLASVEHGNLAAGLAQCDEATLPLLGEEDRRRAQNAHRQLEAWRKLKDVAPIAQIVERVVQESGFEAALLAEFLGERKRANVAKLIRIARKYDQEPGFTLADFVARLKADRDHPPREEQAATTDEQGESVRLMTIHKAKGLEFPVVFLPDLDRRPSARRDLVVFDTEIGPIVQAVAEGDDTEEVESTSGISLGVLIDKERRKQRDRAEDLRIFYVATTRARDILVLSTSGDPRQKTESVALKTLQFRFDLESGHCLAAAPNAPIQSVVHVLPPEIDQARHRRKRRVRPIPLRGIARLIETTVAAEHPAIETPHTHVPKYQNLDPCLALPTARAQVARLVRDLLVDPRIQTPFDVQAAAPLLARRQFPAAGPRAISQAIERASAALSGPLGRAMRDAQEVRHDIPWGLSRPEVVQGRIDLAYRPAKGGWMLVLISDCTADQATEHLRARLSREAAASAGLSPVAAVWLYRHGTTGAFERVVDV